MQKKLPALESCTPPFFLNGGHRQTIVGHFYKYKTNLPLATRHTLSLKDGDSLALEHYLVESPNKASTLVIGFHGLGGSTKSDYMQRLAHEAVRHKSDVVLVNHRGCGDGRGLARKPYHSGCIDDLEEVIKYYRSIYKKIFVVGYSLSGNALLLLLANSKTHTQPDGAISVNAPINLVRTSEILPKGFNRVYDFRFIKNLKKEIEGRGKKIDLKWSTTLPDLDSLYTAPEAGFKSRDEYYEKCSAMPHLEKIRIPTIMITAKDDPFIDYRDYLKVRPVVEKHPHIHMHLENRGGHMGYLAFKKSQGVYSWLDYALNGYLGYLFKL